MSGTLIMWTMLSALKGLGDFLYDYQTLIAGIGAIAAAYFAAKPVWKQLELTQTQASGVLRDMLSQRRTEVRQAKAALTERVGQKLLDLDHLLGWQDEDEKLSEHDAFGQDQILSDSVRWLRLGYHWRDSSQVEGAREMLIEKIDALLGVLNDIHAPAHTDQHDEDHSISDEDWAAFLARGEAAKDEVYKSVGDARDAYRRLLEDMDAEAAVLQKRLTQVNEALIAG
jgi:hypothetical protein